uniref:Neprosin PEP catalytic domain-containing protein n=1 Tax=Oryza punctata TaxID=4537 RepID=A0A0E0MDZ3_ORYPU
MDLNSDETPAANVILAGWNVYPESYNDSQTHFTTSWFVEESSKGCLDMHCPGFQRTAGNAHPIDHDLAYISDCYPVTDVKDGMFSYGGPGNVC